MTSSEPSSFLLDVSPSLDPHLGNLLKVKLEGAADAAEKGDTGHAGKVKVKGAADTAEKAAKKVKVEHGGTVKVEMDDGVAKSPTGVGKQVGVEDNAAEVAVEHLGPASSFPGLAAKVEVNRGGASSSSGSGGALHANPTASDLGLLKEEDFTDDFDWSFGVADASFTYDDNNPMPATPGPSTAGPSQQDPGSSTERPAWEDKKKADCTATQWRHYRANRSKHFWQQYPQLAAAVMPEESPAAKRRARQERAKARKEWEEDPANHGKPVPPEIAKREALQTPKGTKALPLPKPLATLMGCMGSTAHPTSPWSQAPMSQAPPPAPPAPPRINVHVQINQGGPPPPPPPPAPPGPSPPPHAAPSPPQPLWSQAPVTPPKESVQLPKAEFNAVLTPKVGWKAGPAPGARHTGVPQPPTASTISPKAGWRPLRGAAGPCPPAQPPSAWLTAPWRRKDIMGMDDPEI